MRCFIVLEGVSGKHNSTGINILRKMIRFETTLCMPPGSSIYLLSNVIQFRHINQIVYHLLDVLVSVVCFICGKLVGHLRRQKSNFKRAYFITFNKCISWEYGSKFVSFFFLQKSITSSSSIPRIFPQSLFLQLFNTKGS